MLALAKSRTRLLSAVRSGLASFRTTISLRPSAYLPMLLEGKGMLLIGIQIK